MLSDLSAPPRFQSVQGTNPVRMRAPPGKGSEGPALMEGREIQFYLLPSVAVPNGTPCVACGGFYSWCHSGVTVLGHSIHRAVPLFPQALLTRRSTSIISRSRGLLNILLCGIATGSRIERCGHPERHKLAVAGWVLASLCAFVSFAVPSTSLLLLGILARLSRVPGVVCSGLICRGASECWQSHDSWGPHRAFVLGDIVN